MEEQEVKEIVEKIVELEGQSDDLTGNDNFIESSACTREVQKLEEGLEQQGYFLGEDGTNMLVYQASPLRFARSTWLVFDCDNWQWRQS